jgi:hypothetical protein
LAKPLAALWRRALPGLVRIKPLMRQRGKKGLELTKKRLFAATQVNGQAPG